MAPHLKWTAPAPKRFGRFKGGVFAVGELTFADHLVIGDGSVGIRRLKLIAEGVHQLLVTVDGDDIIAQRGDDQLVGEAAHPLLVLDGVAQVLGELRRVVAVLHAQRAEGEGVGVHHVHEGGGVVDERRPQSAR